MGAVVGPSRNIPGVIHFDVVRDVIDTSCVMAVEVFDDRAALDRQEELPEVAAAMALFESGALAAEPEYEIYEVSSVSSPG
jgi:quinol monooxygenase YgiN